MGNRKARDKAVGTRGPILVETLRNARWSWRCVYDQFANGHRFRVLNVVHDVTRQCLAAIPDTTISGPRVARELTALIKRRGKLEVAVAPCGTSLRDALPDSGQRHGTDLECRPAVVFRAPDRMALHRTGKGGIVEGLNGRLRGELPKEALILAAALAGLATRGDKSARGVNTQPAPFGVTPKGLRS